MGIAKEEVTVVETIQAVKGKGNELKKALIELVPISRTAKGCLQYDLLEPAQGRGEEFLVLMRWENLADLHRHDTSPYIAEFVQKYDKILYASFSVSEWRCCINGLTAV